MGPPLVQNLLTRRVQLYFIWPSPIVSSIRNITPRVMKDAQKTNTPLEGILEQVLTQCLLLIERRTAGTIQAQLQLTHEISFAICFTYFG